MSTPRVNLTELAVAVQNAVQQTLAKHGAVPVDHLWVGFVAPEAVANLEISGSRRRGGSPRSRRERTTLGRPTRRPAAGRRRRTSSLTASLASSSNTRPQSRPAVSTRGSRPILCPSAQPHIQGSVAFGIVAGSPDDPRVAWIESRTRHAGSTCTHRPRRSHAGPAHRRSLREKKCCHFDGTDCHLADRLVQLLPAVSEKLPPCRIRPDCRWFLQEGSAACRVCPQIVTYAIDPSPELNTAATPVPRTTEQAIVVS